MSHSNLVALAVLAMCGLAEGARAADFQIGPSDDASIYQDGSIDHSLYLEIIGSTAVAFEFSSSLYAGHAVTHADLTVSPYALPFSIPVVDVYGYQSGDGAVTAADDPGSFLGTWNFGTNLLFHQVLSFDVTSFVASASAPYAGFRLVCSASCPGPGDIFESLEFSYGRPAQLVVSTPEPGAVGCMIVALVVLALGRGRRLPRAG